MNAPQQVADNPNTRRLAALEAVIESGLRTFVEVGNALFEIRDQRLFLEQGFPTFDAYCRRRWPWGRNYINKQIAAAEVVRNLGTTVPTPVTERQARELARLTPERQREVAATIDFTTATAKEVHVAVEASTARTAEPAQGAVPTGKRQQILQYAAMKKMTEGLSYLRGLYRGLSDLDVAKATAGMTVEEVAEWQAIAHGIAKQACDFERKLKAISATPPSDVVQ
jgi:hypothetical protein